MFNLAKEGGGVGERIYIQIDGVAMGSPLGTVLANISMTELEITMIPSLRDYLQNRKRLADDTFAFVTRVDTY